jgi:hypothetical protein
MLEFTISDSAPQSTLIRKDSRVATAGHGRLGRVGHLRNGRESLAAPVKLAALVTQAGRVFREHEVDGSRTFLPFGDRARPGARCGSRSTGNVAPQPSMNFALLVAEAPGAAAACERGRLRAVAVPRRRFSVGMCSTASRCSRRKSCATATSGLARSGIVATATAAAMAAGIPEVVEGPRAFWIRLRFTYGTFAEDPKLNDGRRERRPCGGRANDSR